MSIDWRAAGIWALAVVALCAGWWLFLFTCDDAYIAWRYASNLMDGHGLVWNPEPFRPVEGYSSLLWVLLLSAIWALTGLEPPQTANPLLLLASIGSLALVARSVMNMRLSAALAPWRHGVLAVVLAGTVSNRTFLIWSSSGLEAAMLTLGILAWCHAAWFIADDQRRVTALGLLAAYVELLRPDGLLFVAAAGLAAAVHVFRSRNMAEMMTFIPMGVPIAHLLWRWSTYGEWLPNTYYAKHAAPWPLSGTIFLSAFLTEYAFWIPLLLGIGLGVRALAQGVRPRPDPLTAVAMGAVIGQFAYYTFDIGGDHFGFRIYHHLIPLVWLGLVAMLDRAGWSARRTFSALLMTFSLGQVIPWTHHVLTEDLAAVRARDGDPHRISGFFPPGLHLWPLAWEEQQAWLRGHFVGLRRRAHVNYLNQQRERFPPREVGRNLDLGPDIPVIALSGVGYPGWVLPQVAIVDQLGLNDAVVARTPVTRDVRKMAHDRQPPPGYVACFRPNVTASRGVVRAARRARPLTPEHVRTCERAPLPLTPETP